MTSNKSNFPDSIDTQSIMISWETHTISMHPCDFKQIPAAFSSSLLYTTLIHSCKPTALHVEHDDVVVATKGRIVLVLLPICA